MKTLSIFLALFSLLISGCSHTPLPAQQVNNGVNHVILLWLKDPGNLKQQQQIIDATRSLEKIPGVINIRVGTVMPSERSIVDDSFNIGIHMLFTDKSAMQQYVSHPEHTKTVSSAIMPFVEKILIYDFEE